MDVSGRPQVMGNGVQQSAVQPFAFPRGFHVTGALESIGAFESDGYKAPIAS